MSSLALYLPEDKTDEEQAPVTIQESSNNKEPSDNEEMSKKPIAKTVPNPQGSESTDHEEKASSNLQRQG